MRTLYRSRPNTTTTNAVDRRQPKSDDTPARRPTPQLIADAVIASYIRDISQQHPSPNNHLPRRRPD
jgi:hypothetical protein